MITPFSLIVPQANQPLHRNQDYISACDLVKHDYTLP